MEKLHKYKAVFLIAPTGLGKTSLVLEIYERNQWNIVFVSPLKTLEQEVKKRASLLHGNKVFFESLTAEKVPKFLDQLSKAKRESTLIIFDEIHLWNFWGNTFRQRLWECFYLIASMGLPILGLTATLKHEYLEEWQELFEIGSYDLSVLNLGNGEMRFKPSKKVHYYGLPKLAFNRRVLFEVSKGGTCLIFCEYREEVGRWVKNLADQGIEASSCLGGEALVFSQRCEQRGFPRVIVATTVLSHGVNLGDIEKVFISYEVKDWDLYTQMMARGGRNGKKFKVFSYQREGSHLWNKFVLWAFDRYLRLFYA